MSNDRIKEAKRDLYRTVLLDTAEGAFAEHGYDAAKVQQVARQAGVSLATLYGVFPTKFDLLRAIHRRRLEELFTQIDPIILADADPLTQLRMGYEAYLTFHIAHPNYLRMHLAEGTTWALADDMRTPEQNNAWVNGLKLTTSQIKTGINQGLFIDENPELLARTMLAIHQVYLTMWIKRGMKQSAVDLVREADRQLIRTMCRTEHVATLLAQTEDKPMKRRTASRRRR